MSTIPRAYSDKYVPGMSDYDLFKNKNQDYTNTTYFKFFYLSLVIAFWGLLHITRLFTLEDCWTVTNVVHGVVRFSSFDLLILSANNITFTDNFSHVSLDKRMSR
jgi:hypothetical protein